MLFSNKQNYLTLFVLILTVLLLGPQSIGAQSMDRGFGRRTETAATGDLAFDLGAVFNAEYLLSDEEANEFDAHELEISLGANIDPYFSAVATFEIEDHGAELEEGFLTTQLPYKTQLQFGRQLLPFGYLNDIHSHDYPQVDGPLVLEQLTDGGDLTGEGAHIEWMAPLMNPTLTLTAGAYEKLDNDFSAEIHVNHSNHDDDKIDLEGRPGLLRAESFWQSQDRNHNILAGVSYISGIGERDQGFDTASIQYIGGADLRYRYTPAGDMRGLTLSGEYLLRESEFSKEYSGGDYEAGDKMTDAGFYTYAQWDFDNYWGVGYRYDNTDVAQSDGDKDLTGNTLYGEWRPTEFSRLRLQYQDIDILDHGEVENDDRIMMQGTFFLGWHPPHEF